MSADRPPQRRSLTPDLILAWWPVVVRIAGLIGVAHQAVFARLDRPWLLGIYGGMMGLSEVASAIVAGLRDRDRNG